LIVIDPPAAGAEAAEEDTAADVDVTLAAVEAADLLLELPQAPLSAATVRSPRTSRNTRGMDHYTAS
jgi:hypothetical protein